MKVFGARNNRMTDNRKMIASSTAGSRNVLVPESGEQLFDNLKMAIPSVSTKNAYLPFLSDVLLRPTLSVLLTMRPLLLPIKAMANDL